MTNNTVVNLVEDALANQNTDRIGARLLVLTDGLRQQDGWWYVPVYPEKEVSRLYDLYDVLALAEEDLESSGLNIQLIPAHTPELVG